MSAFQRMKNVRRTCILVSDESQRVKLSYSRDFNHRVHDYPYVFWEVLGSRTVNKSSQFYSCNLMFNITFFHRQKGWALSGDSNWLPTFCFQWIFLCLFVFCLCYLFLGRRGKTFPLLFDVFVMNVCLYWFSPLRQFLTSYNWLCFLLKSFKQIVFLLLLLLLLLIFLLLFFSETSSLVLFI